MLLKGNNQHIYLYITVWYLSTKKELEFHHFYVVAWFITPEPKEPKKFKNLLQIAWWLFWLYPSFYFIC